MKILTVINKQNNRLFLVAMIIPFLLMSCNSSTKKEITNQTNSEEVSQVPISTQEIVSNSKFEIVSNDKVCMVNNRYMYVNQIPIKVDGITYYGCCEDCVMKIQKNLGDVRYAKEPITGDKVDKANAIIVQNIKDGMVYYFGTKELADSFIKEQG